jgi:hypothetical protein
MESPKGMLAVNHQPPERRVAHGCHNFRKIARQRLAGFGLQHDRIARLEGEAAEAVPFGFELPAGLLR